MPFIQLLCKLCISSAIAISLTVPSIGSSSAVGSQSPQPTIVYVVRHAEKSDANPADRDPALSLAGELRSEALAAALRDVTIDATFATEYKRTQLTVQPTAKAHGIDVTVVEARDPSGLAARIVSDFHGKTVLVAGHSNTVPAVLKALGASEAPKLAESDYDNLFIVTLMDDHPPTLQRLHYGAPNMTRDLNQQLATDAAAMLDRFHEAAAKADEDHYFACFEPDAVFLGTDAGERWTLDQFKTFAMPYFQRESAWVYNPVDRTINVSDDGAYAWFDEQLESASYGRCRGTGTLHRSDGQWRIAQYHLSIPIPNDIAKEVVELVRQHAGNGK